MDVYEAVLKRRSIRKYMDQPIEWEKLGRIIEAGRLAPCAGNLQPWKFVVVTEKELRKQLSEACLKQYWMQSAPVHIVVCAEITKLSRFYGIRGERLYSIQSCAAAAESMILMATSLDLATCWVSAFDEEMIKRILRIPDFVRPQVIITVGIGDEVVPEPPKYTVTDVTFLQYYESRRRDPLGTMGFTSHHVEKALKNTKDFLENAGKSSDSFIGKLSKKLRGEGKSGNQ
jgi:nitroreductase